MTKASFSFRAIRAGSYLYYFFLGKMNRRRLRNVAIGAAATFAINSASAQCNTFQNADAENPLLSVLDSTKTIDGFAFADIDGDGDEDVYVSYRNSTYPPVRGLLHLFKNIGSKEHPVYKEDTNTGFGNIKAGYQNPFMQFVDIDGDGDLDYYASEDALDYYDFGAIVFCENIGTATVPRFKIGGDDPTPYISSHVYQPFAFADVDGDGDLDLYIADESNGYGFSYYQRIYYNSGTKKKGVFNLDDYHLNTIDGNTNRTYYDWNKDGLLDFFGVTYKGGEYIKNIGSIHKPRYVNASQEGPVFKNGAPYRMIDLNNDGVPEVFDFNAHYSTLAPLAVITDTLVIKGGQKVTVLYSKYGGSDYTFRWEYGGETMEGSDKNYILPALPGKYTLYVTDACGTGVSLDYKNKRNTTLTAENKSASIAGLLDQAVTVKAYPNPFVNSITLQLPGTLCTVKITDIAGRVLLKQTTSATTFHTGEKLKPGTYTVNVFDGSGKLFSTIIIKQ